MEEKDERIFARSNKKKKTRNIILGSVQALKSHKNFICTIYIYCHFPVHDHFDTANNRILSKDILSRF